MKFFTCLSVLCVSVQCCLGAPGIGPLDPLPAGAIQPRGWLAEMAATAAKGYTGDMESINRGSTQKFPVSAWKNMHPKARGWANYEQEGYHLDGWVRLAYQLKDPSMIERVKAEIDPVLALQKADGSFVPANIEEICKRGPIDQGLMNPETRLTTKDDGEESLKDAKARNRKLLRLLPDSTSRYLWSISVFNRAVLALSDASGDPKYLDFLVKYYRQFPDFKREVPAHLSVSGTELHFSRHLINCEVMFEVAQRSGDPLIYEKAAAILKRYESGMVQTWLRNDFDLSRVCHGVTFNELFKLYATSPSSNPDYTKAAEAAYDFLMREHVQPHGVNTANEYLRGVGGFKGTELCNIADFSWSVTWLARRTGRAAYGDALEQAFFNAFPAAIDHYQRHAYLISPNRLPGIECTQERSEKHNFMPVWKPECCTGNLNRVLPNFLMYMGMKTQGGGLALLTYGPNRIHTSLNRVDTELITHTDYPFRDRLTIELNPETPVRFALYLRIPQWCSTPSIQVNDQLVPGTVVNGFVKLDQEWTAGDRVQLILPMHPQLHDGVEISLKKKGTHEDLYIPPGGSRLDTSCDVVTGASFQYVTCGPLLYTLGFMEKEANTAAMESVDYNYALIADAVSDAQIATKKLAGWVWQYDHAPVELKVLARKVDWKITENVGSLPLSAHVIGPPEEITLVPFGCAKFRLTLFPVGE